MPGSRKLAQRRGRPPHDDVLTPAEWAIVHAIRHGMTNARIAARRGINAESGEPVAESTLYLRVDDIGAAYAELAARGVEFAGAPHLVHRHADGTEEWMAFFKDPEGRFLALMSQPRPTKT